MYNNKTLDQPIQNFQFTFNIFKEIKVQCIDLVQINTHY